MNKATPSEGLLTCGIDVGSNSVKVALLRTPASLSAIVGASPTSGGAPAAAPAPTLMALHSARCGRQSPAVVVATLLQEALGAAGLLPSQLAYVASTGEGEWVRPRHGHFFSMTAHGRAGLFLVPHASAVLDAGALGLRALRINDQGRVLEHRVSAPCASGFGQFLENLAHHLGVPLDAVTGLAATAPHAEPINAICAVLSETEVINRITAGATPADIFSGIHRSLARHALALLKGVGAAGVVAVTGALAQNGAWVRALRDLAAPQGEGLSIVAAPHAPFAGALGAALLGAQRLRLASAVQSLS